MHTRITRDKSDDQLMPDHLSDTKNTLAPKVLEFMPRTDPGLIVVLAAFSLVVMIAVICLRRKIISHQLSTRVSALHLPVSTFDPSLEEVHRAGRRLTRIRPARWVIAPIPANAMRVTLATNSSGLVEYRTEGPQSARSIVQSTPFEKVEVVPENRLGGDLEGEEGSPDKAL